MGHLCPHHSKHLAPSSNDSMIFSYKYYKLASIIYIIFPAQDSTSLITIRPSTINNGFNIQREITEDQAAGHQQLLCLQLLWHGQSENPEKTCTSNLKQRKKQYKLRT
ncbi:hypothetical protein Dimus_027674 [Dionaea muscipula]